MAPAAVNGSGGALLMTYSLMIVKRYHMGSFWMSSQMCATPGRRLVFEINLCARPAVSKALGRKNKRTNRTKYAELFQGADRAYLLEYFDPLRPPCCDHRPNWCNRCPRASGASHCAKPCSVVGASMAASPNHALPGEQHTLHVLARVRPHVQFVLHSRRNLVKWAYSQLSARLSVEHAQPWHVEPHTLEKMARHMHWTRVQSVGLMESVVPLTHSGRFITIEYEDMQLDVDGALSSLLGLAAGLPAERAARATSDAAGGVHRALGGHSTAKVSAEALRLRVTNFESLREHFARSSSCLLEMLISTRPLSSLDLPLACAGLREEGCWHSNPRRHNSKLLPNNESTRGVLGEEARVGSWCPARKLAEFWQPNPALAVAVGSSSSR